MNIFSRGILSQLSWKNCCPNWLLVSSPAKRTAACHKAVVYQPAEKESSSRMLCVLFTFGAGQSVISGCARLAQAASTEICLSLRGLFILGASRAQQPSHALSVSKCDALSFSLAGNQLSALSRSAQPQKRTRHPGYFYNRQNPHTAFLWFAP